MRHRAGYTRTHGHNPEYPQLKPNSSPAFKKPKTHANLTAQHDGARPTCTRVRATSVKNHQYHVRYTWLYAHGYMCGIRQP